MCACKMGPGRNTPQGANVCIIMFLCLGYEVAGGICFSGRENNTQKILGATFQACLHENDTL